MCLRRNKDPACYASSGNLIPDELSDLDDHHFMTNKGLKITLRLIRQIHAMETLYAILACRPDHDISMVVAIPIEQNHSFCVRTSSVVSLVERNFFNNAYNRVEIITLLRSLGPMNRNPVSRAFHPFLIRRLPQDYYIDRIHPGRSFDTTNRIVQRPPAGAGSLSIYLRYRWGFFDEVQTLILVTLQPIRHRRGP